MDVPVEKVLAATQKQRDALASDVALLRVALDHTLEQTEAPKAELAKKGGKP